MLASVWMPFKEMPASLVFSGKMNKIRRVEEEGLKDLQHNEVLYISAHCDKLVDYISDGEDNTLKVSDLCDRLIEAVLRKTHLCIKLWLCYAGCGMECKKGFGYDFWKAMHDHGFHNLTVFAYTELTVDPLDDGHKYCYDFSSGKRLGQAKGFRVGIRGDGKFIQAGQS
jgi:hypothetical protein